MRSQYLRSRLRVAANFSRLPCEASRVQIANRTSLGREEATAPQISCVGSAPLPIKEMVIYDQVWLTLLANDARAVLVWVKGRSNPKYQRPAFLLAGSSQIGRTGSRKK